MPVEMNHGKPTITGIPRNAKLTIVELPSRTVLIQTKTSKTFTPTLDPGAYAYTIVHSDPATYGARGVWREKGTFLVDLTKEQAVRLHSLQPRVSKGLMTSEGPRWRCQFVGCNNQEFTSKIGALIHEGEHFGVDILRSTPEEVDKAQGQAAVHAQAQKAAATQRPGGVPVSR